jgi:tRNA(adenine34) deaminase
MKPKWSPERDWLPYMQRALELAKQAELNGDVPVGALLVNVDGKIISEAFNEREFLKDPTAHAEVLALKAASQKEESWRLKGCTLVVTLEPCVMCAGALSLSRLDRVVFGCRDPRAGAMGSRYNIHQDAWLNHEIVTVEGILEEECRAILQNFFRSKRT